MVSSSTRTASKKRDDPIAEKENDLKLREESLEKREKEFEKRMAEFDKKVEALERRLEKVEKESNNKDTAASNDEDSENAAPTNERSNDEVAYPTRDSAYMLWLKKNKSRISKPGMSALSVSKQVAKEWSAHKAKLEKAAAHETQENESDSEEDESPKVVSTKRAKKDHNAPKRGSSAYMLWLHENRPRIRKPGMSVIDISRNAGIEWNKLRDKSKWEKAAAEDKKRYEREMAQYEQAKLKKTNATVHEMQENESESEEDESPKVVRRRHFDHNAPKRGTSAFMLWLNENRARITKPGMTVIDVSKNAGIEWSALRDEERTKWEKASAEDRKRYEREMKEYEKNRY